MFARIAPGESLTLPFDAALPGGMSEGRGDVRYRRPMASGDVGNFAWKGKHGCAASEWASSASATR